MRIFRNVYFFSQKPSLGLCLLIAVIFSPISHHCYGQVPTVTYDFTSGSIDSVLPFDQRFNLKLEHQQKDLDSLFVTFFELPNTKRALRNYYGKRCLKGISDTATNKNLDRSDYPVLQLRTACDTGCSIVAVPFQLRHSRDYRISFGGYQDRPLNSSEKEILADYLKQQMNQNSTLDVLLGGMGTSSAGSMINDIIFDFKRQVLQILQEKDPAYRFKPVSEAILDLRFRNYQELFVKFYDNYLSLLGSYTQNYPSLTPLVAKINWQTFPGPGSELYSVLSDFDFGNETIRASFMEKLNTAISMRNQMLEEAEKLIEDVILANITYREYIAPTYHNSLTENASIQFTVDLGFIYSYYLDDVLSTITMTIYPRPVNKNLPFKHYTGMDRIWTRTGVVLGTTMSSIAKQDQRAGYFGNDKALLLGIGYRILPMAKISAGGMFFKQIDPNPLVRTQHNTVQWFVGISMDLDVAKLVRQSFEENYNNK